MQHSDCEIIIGMQNAFRWMNQRTFVSEQYTHGILPAFGGKRTDLVTFALRISLQNVRPVNLQLHPSTKIEAVYKGMHDYASNSIQIVKRLNFGTTNGTGTVHREKRATETSCGFLSFMLVTQPPLC